eukprot:Skav228455  [mRNA]  locus=scaffold1058:204169:216090:- [translate_table: standard]
MRVLLAVFFQWFLTVKHRCLFWLQFSGSCFQVPPCVKAKCMAMFQSLLCSYTDGSGSADAVLTRLMTNYKKLIHEEGYIDTKTDAGFNATAVFLESLEATARAMRLEPANRSYRSGFTINYRALFPDESRNYRVDILEASVEQNAVIWVNGDKFEFSQEAMQCAEDLQRAWSELCGLLERWKGGDPGDRPQRTEMRTSLVTLDVAWASFEKKYIGELIAIEDKARKLIVQAVDSEKRLKDLEAKFGETEALLARPEYQAEQRRAALPERTWDVHNEAPSGNGAMARC